MSELKINQDLFLGEQELNRLVRFLREDGYQQVLRANSSRFGIVNDERLDPNFTNLKITAGSSPTKITLNAGIAIDDQYRVLSTGTQVDIYDMPADNSWRWIVAEYATTVIETGIVNISASGQLTGLGTLFTEVLRGQPNFPAVIKFPNSVLNTGEYEVVTVTNDTDALLTGNFTAEIGVEYAVVGTFTPDKPVPAGSKEIFVYDSIAIQPPSFSNTAVSGSSFALARVKSDGITLDIEDARNEYYETKGSYALDERDLNQNPLCGIDEIKWDTLYSDRSENIVRVGWGFFASSGDWSMNPTTDSLTITAGSGGAFKSTSDFTDGDFDGWRVYYNGTNMNDYSIITTSTIVGTTITLNLRQLETAEIGINANASIVVVPNIERISFQQILTTDPNRQGLWDFPVQEGYGFIRVKVEGSLGGLSTLIYRHIWGKNNLSNPFFMNAHDYLDETSFDSDGNQIASNTSSVSAFIGLFTLQTDPLNFLDQKAERNQSNIFTEYNEFRKQVSHKHIGDRQIVQSPNGFHRSVEVDDLGNSVRVLDGSALGALAAIKHTTTADMIPLTLEIGAPITLLHNVTINAADISLGYHRIYNHHGQDIFLTTGDYVTLMYYGGSWHLTNLQREADTYLPFHIQGTNSVNVRTPLPANTNKTIVSLPISNLNADFVECTVSFGVDTIDDTDLLEIRLYGGVGGSTLIKQFVHQINDINGAAIPERLQVSWTIDSYVAGDTIRWSLTLPVANGGFQNVHASALSFSGRLP